MRFSILKRIPGGDVNSTFKNLSITLGSNPGPNCILWNNVCAVGSRLKQASVPSSPFGQGVEYWVPNQKAEFLFPAALIS